MKKAKLLILLEQVPDDAEIVVVGPCDDILGDYSYNPAFSIEAQECDATYEMSISRCYRPKMGVKTVYVLE